MIIDRTKIMPFDAFTAVYNLMMWSGVYRPLNESTSHLMLICHKIYRICVLLFTVVYNALYLIFIIQHRDNLNKVMDSLLLEIPHINLVIKIFTMFYQEQRFDKINNVLKGSIFATTDDQDELILRNNIKEMNRLTTVITIGLTVFGCIFPLTVFINRIWDKNVTVNLYVPFKTDTWFTFSIALFIQYGTVLWVGHNHVAVDCLISTYYSQVQTQLKIIKNQLQGLLPKSSKKYDGKDFQYQDLNDKTILHRFVQIIKRYDTLIWYKNEVNTAFNGALTVQFLTSSISYCLIIYRMTMVNFMSLLYLVLLSCILLSQIFLYCLFGNLVEVESQTVNDSLYASDWLLLSPSFRRMLLITMCRWSQPIQLRVIRLIPLTLNTFVSIVKFSYTLYTMLAVTAE